MNQIHQMDQINQINEIDQIKETNQINQTNQTNQKNQKNLNNQMRPLQNPGENDLFMEESCLRLRFYLIEYPLKDFDEKGDIRDGI